MDAKFLTAYFFLAPLDLLPLVGPFTLTTVYALGFVGMMCLRIASGKNTFQHAPVTVWVSAYLLILWGLTTAFWSLAPGATILAVAAFAQVFSVFCVACTIRRFDHRHALWALALGGCLVAALILREIPNRPWHGRLSIPGVDENLTAFTLAVALASAVVLWFSERSTWLRLLLLCVMVLQFEAVLLTASRTGLIAVALTLFVAAALNLAGASIRQRLSSAGLLALGLGGLYVASSWSLLPDRLVPYFTGDIGLADPNRGYINSVFLDLADVWVWKGAGYGADATLYESRHAIGRNVHQVYLKMWVELGLPGLVLMLALVVGGLLLCFRLVEWRVGAIVATPIFIFSWTLGGLERNALPWCLLILLTLMPRRGAT